MNKVNKIIFVGLISSGLAIIPYFVFNFLLKFNIPFLFGIFFSGHYFGLWFGIAAIISFFYGSFMYLIGRMNNYWQSLYPINFGLTLLGMTLWQYTLNIPVALLFAAFVFALAITFILYKISATKSRWLVIALIVAIFTDRIIKEAVFWETIIIGVLFIGLSLTTRYIRKQGDIPPIY